MSSEATANVRVLVRVRPLNKSEASECGSIGRTNVLTIKSSSDGKIDFSNGENTSTDAIIVVNNGGEELSNTRRRATGFGPAFGNVTDGDNNSTAKQFTVDAVYGPRSTQADVYDSLKGIVDAVTSGYNGTIVAYGQTGSGKTHTVFGQTDSDESQVGLVQRSLRDIFYKMNLTQAKAVTKNSLEGADAEDIGTTETSFRSSFFEIFNERVYDLLSKDSLEKNLAVREDANHVYVEGLKEVKVQNTADAENIIAQGIANRHVSATSMNRTSSRSHAVFVLSVRSEHVNSEGLRKVRNSKFTLVDLAGSERQKSAATVGERLKEASMINKSLLCLGHVINALVDREAGRVRHIPFRNSKLTFLLRDTWGGNSKTCLVATVSPSGKSLVETVSTLHFAQRAKLIKNNAILNEDTCGTVAALQQEVAKLRSQLAGSPLPSTEPNEQESLRQSQYELIDSLKRCALRAEDRILLLEKKVSEEGNIVRTLKRKVREEAMVRKFKERRLDYLQTSVKASSEQDQMSMLREEISSLQKRLETPSTEAIEWKVAYEQVKETLDSQIEKDGLDNVILEDKVVEFEATIERLCNEKIALEERVSELAQSSTDTQDEIDSILKEVDRLESEMISLQDEIIKKENENVFLNKQAVQAEEQIKKSKSDLESSRNIALEREKEINRLQEASLNLSVAAETLRRSLEEKSSEIVKLSKMGEEIESAMRITVHELRIKLNESATLLTNKNFEEIQLKEQVSTVTKENSNLNQKIQSILSEINVQKCITVELEEKIKVILREKDEFIEIMKQENTGNENQLRKEIESLQQGVTLFSEEKSNFKSELCQIKDQARIAHSTIDENKTVIKEMETKIKELNRVLDDSELSITKEKEALNRKLSEQQLFVDEMKSKLESAGEERQIALYKEEKMKNTQVALEKEIEQIKKEGKEIAKEKIRLENVVAQNEVKYAKTERDLECQRALLDTMKASVMEAEAKRDASREIDLNKQHQIERKLQGRINELQMEREQILKEIANLKQMLDESQIEYKTVVANLKNQTCLISSLNEQLTTVKKGDNDSIAQKNTRIQSLEKQLEDIVKANLQLETGLLEKTSALRTTSNKLSDSENRLGKLTIKIQSLEVETEKKLRKEFQVQEAIRMSHKEETKSHNFKIRTLNEKIELLEADLIEYNKDGHISKEHHEKVEREKSDLKNEMNKYRMMTEETVCELQCKEYRIRKLEEEIKVIQSEKEIGVDEAEEKMKLLESEQVFLKNRAEKCAALEEEAKRGVLLQKDRMKLLNREKNSLQFELKALQDDKDTFSCKIQDLESGNKELEIENCRLKRCIEDQQKVNSTQDLIPSVTIPTTITNSANAQVIGKEFDKLSTKMDCMLERMSTCQTVNQMDETFDESMFLPNTEGIKTDDKENVHHRVDAEHSKKWMTPQTLKTPAKLEYSLKKRTPLTDKNSRTRSSKRKHSSGTKHSNWMMFDNRRMFENQKTE